ncbi:hypothetical protein DL98DRAFT_516283 [Cadophora sp. DSE1049]|nr:hypothetical protein DL98DRAFT_516283 [Cadophora sp. DSE1049]
MVSRPLDQIRVSPSKDQQTTVTASRQNHKMCDGMTIIPPLDYTAMDTATLRRVIADMLKELRDQAIGNKKEVTCYIRWRFIEVPNSTYSFDYNSITRNYKDNGGLPSRWDESALENLYRGLTDGRVQAVALDEVKLVLGESVVPPVQDSSIKTSSKRTRLPHKLRDRLIDIIETTIGRPLDPRSSKQIDPRKSDPQPPNLYKWQFSDNYPEFPDKKGGISRWHADQIHACYEALEQGHLTVVNVDPDSSEARQSTDNDSARASTVGRSSITRVTETPSIDGPASSTRATADRDNVRSIARDINRRADFIPAPAGVIPQSVEVPSSTAPLRGLEDLQTQMLGMLNTALKSQAEELESTWKACHVSELSKLRAAVAEAEGRLQKECASHRDSLSSLLAMQRDGEKQRTRIVQLERELREKATSSKAEDDKVRAKLTQMERELEEKVSLARSEGRQSMSDEILKDLDHTVEGERLALRRHHVEQLGKVRAESYQLGLQAGRSEAATSVAAQPNVDQIADIESLKKQHLKELESARNAGREIAYTELSLGPDERVNNLLHNHAEMNSNRKIRELRTIHQNWHDIPQRVLPSYMLPEGHTPGDKTLYLLAKLSKEVDGATASQLLSEEIAERCRQTPNISRNNIVANVDIRNTLDRINPSSLGCPPASQKSIELSQPSQSLAQEKPGEPLQFVEESGCISASLTRSKETQRTALDQGHIDDAPKTPRATKKQNALQASREMIRQTVEIGPAAPSRSANSPRTPALTLDSFMKELPPINVRFPNPLQRFSVSFLREKIGGGEFAFSKVGYSMLKKQIVPWPELIRIIPEHQKSAPRLGHHGAMAFVNGRPGCGEIGKTYPTVFRQSKERFLYIGHYTLSSKETVSLEEWKAWPEEEKLVIAREIRDTNWGETLLTGKCLRNREELAQLSMKEHVEEILKLFDRESEPNLRMTWAILRLDEFRIKDYDVLKSARAHLEPKNIRKEVDGAPNRGTSLDDYFRVAMEQFVGDKPTFNLTLGPSSDLTTVRISPEIVGKTVEEAHRICRHDPHKFIFFGKSFSNLVHEVYTRGTEAHLFRMTSQPKSSPGNQSPDTRRHVVDWTRNMFANRLGSIDHVLFALYMILTIYNEQEAQIFRGVSDRRVSAPSTTRNTLTVSTRPLLGARVNRPDCDDSDSDEILYTNPKRRKTTSFTVRPLRTQENQRGAGAVQPSVEINDRGSTIIVDSSTRQNPSPAVKKDVEVSEDDLYGASPQPPVRKRVLSKRTGGV